MISPMPENKSILAKKITRIYLKTYMLIMSIIFTLPIIHMFLLNKNVPLFGANILFYEFNNFNVPTELHNRIIIIIFLDNYSYN